MKHIQSLFTQALRYITGASLTIKIASAAVIVLLVYAGVAHKNGNGYTQTLMLERGTLEQVVEFSGITAPQDRVDLSFESAGKVVYAPYEIGDTIARGSVIASLDTATARADLAREEALLESEEATLAQLERGTRPEELAVDKAQYTQKQNALTDAQYGLVAALLAGYTAADTVVYKNIDDMFDNPTSAVPTLKYDSSKRALEIIIENERLNFERIMNDWQTQMSAVIASATSDTPTYAALLNSLRTMLTASALSASTSANANDTETLMAYANDSIAYLVELRAFLQNIAGYTNALSPSGDLTQTTIDTWQSNIATDRTSVDTAIAALNTAREKLASAQDAFDIETESLALSEAGATPEDILKQKAVVRAQEAKVTSLKSTLADLSVVAPYTGVLIKKDIEVGEIASANTPLFAIDSDNNFKMEAHISELDVVFLQKNMHADITLDAFETTEHWSATITRVDPAESEKNNESGYGIELVFDDSDPRLKAGMTANAHVSVILKEDVIAVPAGYIHYEGNDAYVSVLVQGEVQQRAVVLGTRNTRGIVEITSGVSEGETIVPYDETTK